MPWGLWIEPVDYSLPKPPPGAMRGRSRGITKSPRRAKRRNRRNP